MNKPLLKESKPHPNFLKTLFIYRATVNKVFKDVLGLYDIHHIALSHIDNHHQLLTLSSTPALEFNVFNRGLWHYDKTYNPNWYALLEPALWQSLYAAQHYDELYFMKQYKYGYQFGISLPIKLSDSYVVYSIASQTKNRKIQRCYKNNHEIFYKIGQYCSNSLLPLLCT